MPIVTVGIDLAKNVYAVHGVDETGKAEMALAAKNARMCWDLRWAMLV